MFKEAFRILKNGGGRMVISDLIADSEIAPGAANIEKWSSCIDGALTKEHYLDSIRKVGFQNVEVLSEQPYIENRGEQKESRKITSIVIRAIKK